MRVLVFAHTPPPFHGQSYMIQLMLENLGKTNFYTDEQLTLLHLNARLSDDLNDVGVWRIGKIFLLIGYIFQAWWMRWKYSPEAFYYVPSPPARRGALYRDWLVLSLVAPLFKIKILHWHAPGLGEWIKESEGSTPFRRLETWLTRRLFIRHDLSCVLNEWGRKDVEIFSPRHIAVVANGTPDPCPEFTSSVLVPRIQRHRNCLLGTEDNPALFNLLFLAHVTRTKGVFDMIDAVAHANVKLETDQRGWRIGLTVAGAFLNPKEKKIFEDRLGHEDLKLKPATGKFRAVVYAGFAGPNEKDRLLREADAMCFPSFYPNEGQPVSVIEALAYGMPVLLSRWRALPQMLSPSLVHLVDPMNSIALAEALILLNEETRFEEYRKYYLDHYSLAAHCVSLRAAFLSAASI